MHVHRSRHVRGFTVLPNYLLQDRRLSYTARGLLADLLSRPDGWREDGRHMADSSPQGRLTVAKALRELAALGYYRVDRIRREDGTFVSEVHVFDTPQSTVPGLTPGSGNAGSGLPAAGSSVGNPVKDEGKVPSLPTDPQPAEAGSRKRGEGGRSTDSSSSASDTAESESEATGPVPVDSSPEAGEAVAALFRVIRPEPRLRLGTVEALDLAPLVAGWLERGCTESDLARALLQGLPAQVHAPVALLRDRLTRKLPAAPAPQPAAVVAARRWHECGGCAAPIPQAGICRACAGLGQHVVGVGSGHAATASGIAKVRAAMGRATVPPQLCRA